IRRAASAPAAEREQGAWESVRRRCPQLTNNARATRGSPLPLGYYSPPKILRFAPQRMQLWHNRRWIKGVMDAGREIHDVGPDPARAIRSVFYEMEHSEITGRGYQGYVQVGH
ncbi:MAG TPA: hypothetical protein VIL91_07765, partial [Gaiellaceae bacterium]